MKILEMNHIHKSFGELEVIKTYPSALPKARYFLL